MKKIQIAIIALCAVTIIGVASNVNAAAIGNTVWNDSNANGIQDAGEEGISGVRVKLYKGNDVETDKTNSLGHYKFKDLDAGHYTVVVAQETLPEGCYNTYDRDGNHDGEYGKKYLKEDDYFTHADFGYKCTANTYVTVGQVSPITGPNTMIAILATAVAVGIAMFVYKRQGKRQALKK